MMLLGNGSSYNSSFGNSDCRAEVKHMSLSVCLTLVFLLGFGLNCFSLWAFCSRVRSWNPGTVLQFNLALSDAIATPATVMTAVYFANRSSWPFGRFLCQVQITLLSAHFYGSILFLMLISVHRYVVVIHFNRSSVIKQKGFVKKLCGGIWMFLLAKGIIYASLLPLSTNRRRMQCLNIYQEQHIGAYLVINFVLFLFGFLVPFSVSATCYSLLARSVSQMNPSTVHGPAVKSKSLRMITVCLLIFVLCFLPLNVTRTIGVVVKRFFPHQCHVLQQVETAYYASWILAGINCCLDPLIYFFGSSNFRRIIRRSILMHVTWQRNNDKRSESDTLSQIGKRAATNEVSSRRLAH